MNATTAAKLNYVLTSTSTTYKALQEQEEEECFSFGNVIFARDTIWFQSPKRIDETLSKIGEICGCRGVNQLKVTYKNQNIRPWPTAGCAINGISD